MIKLTSLLHEMNLDQARFYTSLDRTVANKVITPLWNYLKSQADYVSRNGERLFFYFAGDKTLMTDINSLISSYEDPKGATYYVSNFKEGTILKTVQTERGPKEVQMSLGKVLAMIAKERPEAKDLLDLYNRDMGARRASSSIDTPVIVVSKHPVDIGNMSTDRGWSSCMRLPNEQDPSGGINHRFIKCDINLGTLIAYYLEQGGDLKSLKNATGRVLIKPYYKQDTGDLLMSPGKVYGQVPESFKDFINTLIRSSNLYRVSGFYKIDSSLYSDGQADITLKSYSSFKDLYKSRKNKDFSDMDLTVYTDFLELDLSGANFTNCNLTGVNLTGVKLSGANLTGASLDQARLTRADLSQTKIVTASLSGAVITNANLTGADLSNSSLREVILDGSNLQDAILYQVDLVDSNIKNTNLAGADLRNSYLSFSNLENVILTHADLSETDLQEAKLIQVYLRKANLTKANLYQVKFINVDLTLAVLSEADLSFTIFSDTNLSKVNLRGSNLNGARLEGVDLHEADLTQANLTGAKFLYGSLRGAHLKETDLSSAILVHTDVTGTNFSEAILSDIALVGRNYDATTIWPDNFNIKDHLGKY